MPMRGSCHCGHTQFEVSEAPPGVTRCTCSLCAKRGALWAYYTPAQFRLTSPPEGVATYRWGSRTVKHHFCAELRLRNLFGIAGLVDRQAGLRQSEGRRQCTAARRFRSRCGDGDGHRRQEPVVTPATSARLRQHDPCRRVVAGAFLATDIAVDAGLDQARRAAGLSRRWSSRSPASRGQRLRL